MTISIKTYNEILGEMVRKIIADTPVNDLNPGSVILTLLEAAAQVDFENNAAILSLLELMNIDTLKDIDLDARARDYGLERIQAQKATGFVQISDSSITKHSSNLYQIKSAPIAGDVKLHVVDASLFAPAGQLYIGRGTPQLEGPISYTSITNNGSFYTINLAAALQKDHLISDVVVDAQGTVDRSILAGTELSIPANNRNPSVKFVTIRAAVLPAGEDTITDVPVVASLAGSSGNAGVGTVTTFSSAPFSGATVTNTTAITGGRDTETDDDFRERLKTYTQTLARGTADAIMSAVIGTYSAEDNKQVVSAFMRESVAAAQPATLYIDDGSGFQPSYQGQAIDRIVAAADGHELFVQLSNYPVTRPQVANTVDAPFALADGMDFTVVVDGIAETIYLTSSSFANIASATAAEVIIAINDAAVTFKARLDSNGTRILVYAESYSAETIQVTSSAANEVFKFSTQQVYNIKLYKNGTLLQQFDRSAFLVTKQYSDWSITNDGNLIISVDNTPGQNIAFTTADFDGTPYSGLTLLDWATALQNKIAGVTIVITQNSQLQISSNKSAAGSALKVIGGSYASKMFADVFEAEGSAADFSLNRQTGTIQLATELSAGDILEAGSLDTRGSATSSALTTSTADLSIDADGKSSELVTSVDSEIFERVTDSGITVGTLLTISEPSANTMRIMAPISSVFYTVKPGDYLYLTFRNGSAEWVSETDSGLYMITSKGQHLTEGVDTYIDVVNVGVTTGTYELLDGADISMFRSYTMPQIWKAELLTTPASTPLADLAESLNTYLLGTDSFVYKTSRVRTATTTESTGSIGFATVTGKLNTLLSATDQLSSIPSHIASITNSSDLAAWFRRSTPTTTDADDVAGKVVWFDRVAQHILKGQLSTTAAPGFPGVDLYADVVDSPIIADMADSDLISFRSGANRDLYRSLNHKPATTSAGTQHRSPITPCHHAAGDDIALVQSCRIAPNDSVFVVADRDSVNKFIDITMSRRGQVNADIVPSNSSFSANDIDNETGVTFGTATVWGKTVTDTEFKDYSVVFRARNWYVTGGAGLGNPSMVVRAAEYGRHGEALRFRIEYPVAAEVDPIVTQSNEPDHALVTYMFGSGPNVLSGLTPGDRVRVLPVSGDVYTYKFFSSTLDLAAVAPQNVVSIDAASGLSVGNTGTFSIQSVNSALKEITVYNPDAVSTPDGSPEITDITTVADVVGTSSQYSITATSAAALDGTWFIIYDEIGSVGVYYNVGTPMVPGTTGADREIEILGLVPGDNAATVAAQTVAQLDADPAFGAVSALAIMTITVDAHGYFSDAADGGTPTGFTFLGTVPGTSDVSLHEKFFIIPDAGGTVAVWYDVAGGGVEPLHGADRAIAITTVAAGDGANTVATKTAAALAADAAFASATVLSNVITVTDAVNGVRAGTSAGTSGFTVVQDTAGVDDVYETLFRPLMFMYALVGTDLATITATINASLAMRAAVNTDGDIMLATREEVYTPAGPGDYSASLAYGHDPDPISGLNWYVRVYDSTCYVKEFANTDPQFVMKSPMLLNGIAPAEYMLHSCPNDDTTINGELFHLVPTTPHNILHHMTHKAISPMAVVADARLANAGRRVQISSKLSGTSGAIEIIGGTASTYEFSLVGDAQVRTPVALPSGTISSLELRIPAHPAVLTVGSMVEVYNTVQAVRQNSIDSDTKVSVVAYPDGRSDYVIEPRATGFREFVKFTISDVSATYGRTSAVWRWSFDDSGATVTMLDNTTGTVLVPPDDEVAAGGTDAVALHTTLISNGSSTPQEFTLTISELPTQGDYFTFRSADGSTFAVWFAVDGDTTAPTGASFVAAANQVRVDILSTQSVNEITAAMTAELDSTPAVSTSFVVQQNYGADASTIVVGDILVVSGDQSGWSFGNKTPALGSDRFSSLVVVAVDSVSRYFDVLNPRGVAMASTVVGTMSVNVFPAVTVEWMLDHAAPAQINYVQATSGIAATVTLLEPGWFSEGDALTIRGNAAAGAVTVTSVVDQITLEVSGTFVVGTYYNGEIVSASRPETQYVVQSVGFKDLYEIACVGGTSPRFIDCGVAVDDEIVVAGDTFDGRNAGTFTVVSVSNDSVIVQNSRGIRELNTLRRFNYSNTAVTWTFGGSELAGTAGSFANLAAGLWAKKTEDTEDKYVLVVDTLDALGTSVAPELAVRVLLSTPYQGSSSTSTGVLYDQQTDYMTGRILRSRSDIRVFKGDSAHVADELSVETRSSDWFSVVNSGLFAITDLGVDDTSLKPYIRTFNRSAVSESNISLGINYASFYIRESSDRLFRTLRDVESVMPSDSNSSYKDVFVSSHSYSYKMRQEYGTKIKVFDKLNYPTGVFTGVDGYQYYTGLLRTVQRVVDGYEPDITTYPGRRSFGGTIEILPPLIKRITMTLNVTTAANINISEISSDVQAAIINYVNGLGVGADVIMAEIIAIVMSISGVEAVTFVTPAPTTERVFVADNEKAFTTTPDISIT